MKRDGWSTTVTKQELGEGKKMYSRNKHERQQLDKKPQPDKIYKKITQEVMTNIIGKIYGARQSKRTKTGK